VRLTHTAYSNSIHTRTHACRMLTKDPAQRVTVQEVLAHPWFSQVGGGRTGVCASVSVCVCVCACVCVCVFEHACMDARLSAIKLLTGSLLVPRIRTLSCSAQQLTWLNFGLANCVHSVCLCVRVPRPGTAPPHQPPINTPPLPLPYSGGSTSSAAPAAAQGRALPCGGA